jgi:phosphoglycolate phosphatase
MLDAAFGIKPDHGDFAAMRQEFLDLYESCLCVDTRLFPGMEELLDRLERAGIAWGVVTNKFERFARPVLDGLGLGARSRVIVGGDTCPRPKPFPDSLLHACAALGLAPAKVLYVGDDTRDVQAARAAGMKVFVGGYGYIGGGDPPALWGADAIVDSPFGIGRWLGLEASGASAAAE